MNTKFKQFFSFILPSKNEISERKFSTIGVSTEDIEKQKIKDKVQFLIDDKNIKLLEIFIHNDYVFSSSQLESIVFTSPLEFSKEAKQKIYKNNWKSLSYTIDSKFSIMTSILQNKQFFAERISTSHIGYNLNPDNVKIIDNFCLSMEVLREKYSNTESQLDNENIFKYYSIAKKHKELIIKNTNNVPYYMDADRVVKLQEKFFDQFNNLFNQTHEEVFTKMAQRSRTLQGLKDNISDEISSNIKNFDVSKLPSEAQDLLETINHTYKELALHKNKMSIIQNLDMENLYTKRLPQIIGQYIVIPDKFREVLKSSHDNPETLLLESLQEIKSKIENLGVDLFQDDVQGLKKTRQYLKNM